MCECDFLPFFPIQNPKIEKKNTVISFSANHLTIIYHSMIFEKKNPFQSSFLQNYLKIYRSQTMAYANVIGFTKFNIIFYDNLWIFQRIVYDLNFKCRDINFDILVIFFIGKFLDLEVKSSIYNNLSKTTFNFQYSFLPNMLFDAFKYQNLIIFYFILFLFYFLFFFFFFFFFCNLNFNY